MVATIEVDSFSGNEVEVVIRRRGGSWVRQGLVMRFATQPSYVADFVPDGGVADAMCFASSAAGPTIDVFCFDGAEVRESTVFVRQGTVMVGGTAVQTFDPSSVTELRTSLPLGSRAQLLERIERDTPSPRCEKGPRSRQVSARLLIVDVNKAWGPMRVVLEVPTLQRKYALPELWYPSGCDSRAYSRHASLSHARPETKS